MELFLLWDSLYFYIGLDLELNPESCNERYNEEDKISEQAYRWEGEFSLQFSKEYELDYLGEEEHQIEVAEYVDHKEGVVDGLYVFLHTAECFIKILDRLLNLNWLIWIHQYLGVSYSSLWGIS